MSPSVGKRKEKAVCSVCGEPAQPWQRNDDGTYLHTTCAMQINGSANLHRDA